MLRAFTIHPQEDGPAATTTAAVARPRRGLAHMVAGALLLAIAIHGLWQDIHWIAQPFYAWVWWGYILLLDGFCLWKRGDSLLSTRVHLLFPICVWSITFWMFFELINSHIRNWYYVGVYPAGEFVAGALFTLLAFATVFMGIFQTHDAISATGLWRNWKGRVRLFPPWLTWVLQAIGLTMAALALLWPHYLAPLIWGSFTLVVDPWNYRRGTRSLLRDLEHGDYGLVARLLLAGLVCGLVWESLNFFAPQKWIYTVRGLEQFKLFEMPLLGFLGFPALAFDCMAAFALFASFFLGNRTWERSGDLRYALALRPALLPRTFWKWCAVQVLFWCAVCQYATPVNVASIRVELSHLGMTPAELASLRGAGITGPRQFLRTADSPHSASRLRAQLGWSEARLTALRDRAALYTFKGIGRYHGALLERAGVRSPEDLRSWIPGELHRCLASLAAEEGTMPPGFTPPRLDFVTVWILAAHDRGLILSTSL